MADIIPFKQPVGDIIEQLSKLVENLKNVPLDEIYNAQVIDEDDEYVVAISALNNIAFNLALINLRVIQNEKERVEKC